MTAQSVTPFDPQFASAGVANNVDPDLLAAQAAVESGYNPSAVSPAGAQGLMQIMPVTGKALGVNNPMDPGQSITGGAKLMGQLITQYGNVPDALRAYAGGQNQSNWGPVTQAYPGKVAAAYADIKRAGGIQYAQADTGDTSDANTGATPVAGRPSDAAMMQMLTGGSATPAATSSASATTAPIFPNSVQPVAGRPSDAAMMQMLTGGGASALTSTSSGTSVAASSTPAAASPASSVVPTAPGGDITQFPIVASHLAPDGSGEMTNLGDADYYRFTGKAPPSAAAPGAAQAMGQPPASAQAPAPAAGSPGLASPAASAPAIPITAPNASAPGFWSNVRLGLEHSLSGSGAVGSTLNNVDAWGDKSIPGAQVLDNLIGRTAPVNAQAVAGSQAGQQAFQQGAGQTWGGAIGNTAGNIALTAPLMSVGGAGLDAAGDAVSAVPGIGKLLAGAGNAVRAVPGGGFVTKLLANGAKGALQGAGAAAATSGGSDQPFWDQLEQGAKFGGVAGALIPAAVSGFGSLGRTALGGSTDAETAALAQQAKGYGIDITPAQLSNSPSIHYLDAATQRIPLSGATSEVAAQQAQLNQAIAGTFGQQASKITPQVMSAAKQQIGATLSSIEDSNPVSLDSPFLTQVAAIEKNAQSSLTDPEFKVVSRQLDNVMSNLQPGDTITGQTFGNLIHKGSPLDAALNSRDSNVANYAGQIKGALQDALSRSLSPADQAAYTQARYQYKNLKAIEPLVEKSVNGDISPAGLMQAVRSSYGDMAYSGGGDLGNLARIAQRFLKPLPDSGTAGHISALGVLAAAGDLGGHLLMGASSPGEIATAIGVPVAAGLVARGARAYLGSSGLASGMVRRALSPSAPGTMTKLLGGVTSISPLTAALLGRSDSKNRNATPVPAP